MEPLDIVIYTVVLTAVILAAGQTAFLNLSDKPDEVPLMNKIIGMLGLGAAGFSLFVSPVVLGEVKGPILMMLVLATIGGIVLAGKIKKAESHNQKKSRFQKKPSVPTDPIQR